jgi:predicted transcriptional regulator
MTLSRVTITVPPDVLAEADRRAEELHRSRSWLVAEALRAYLAAREAQPTVVREVGGTYAAGLGPGRLAQLTADLELTPEERVRLAQQAADARPPRRRPEQPDRVICFDRLEDYFAWERHEDLAP